jgi:hypothetical protein
MTLSGACGIIRFQGLLLALVIQHLFFWPMHQLERQHSQELQLWLDQLQPPVREIEVSMAHQ